VADDIEAEGQDGRRVGVCQVELDASAHYDDRGVFGRGGRGLYHLQRLERGWSEDVGHK
jgi:hypothetical protein